MNVVFDQGLCSLLVNKSIASLMFDCREDADTLEHLHNVRLDGVLDIQLLEVMRRRNKEKDTKHGTLSRKTCTWRWYTPETKTKRNASHVHVYVMWHMGETTIRPMCHYTSVDVLALFNLYGVLFLSKIDHLIVITVTEVMIYRQ